ncbi:MAG: hypothetical protein ACE5IJ_05185 [Thermoplasmata archaeon]
MKIKAIHLVISVVVILGAAGASVWLFYELPERETCACSASASLAGSFFISDSGEPKGGFEYTAEYNATLFVTESYGTLLLNQTGGLGDALTKHLFPVSCLCLEGEVVTFGLEGNNVVLVWDPIDPVWDGNYSDHFIASWGAEAPAEAKRGSIQASHFPGLPSHYYVELRLKFA